MVFFVEKKFKKCAFCPFLASNFFVSDDHVPKIRLPVDGNALNRTRSSKCIPFQQLLFYVDFVKSIITQNVDTRICAINLSLNQAILAR